MVQACNADGPVHVVATKEDDSLVVTIAITLASHYDAMLLVDAIQQAVAQGEDLSFAFKHQRK